MALLIKDLLVPAHQRKDSSADDNNSDDGHRYYIRLAKVNQLIARWECRVNDRLH
jgi:hypothetical protein